MSAHRPVAIIDIGSNSVRLVVYSGATRSPSTIFNEKVMAGLGRDLGESGELSAEARERALAAMRRFRLLIDAMGVARTRTVATAAVRDAANCEAFLSEIRALGLDPHVLSGEEEGRLAGLGVISGIPDANGIVGDLGGGSLELADVGGGAVNGRISLPLGVLRLPETRKAQRKAIREALGRTGFAERARGRPFYMVGGSWRALAQLDLDALGHPLPIVHQHVVAPARAAELAHMAAKLDKTQAKAAAISVSRLPTLPAAGLLLEVIAESLAPSALIVSSYGIREGLLYDGLDPAEQSRDPLIEAAREAGAGLGRFRQHGELLDRWIGAIFDDSPAMARLRLAACMLADIAWAAHPDFRAERGIDMALHGNWVGIDPPGRAILAQALFSNFGGGAELPYPAIAALADERALERAAHWGLAMRLGQRLGGGVGRVLERSRLSLAGGAVTLELRGGDTALYGEPVERRLRALAQALGAEWGVVVNGAAAAR